MKARIILLCLVVALGLCACRASLPETTSPAQASSASSHGATEPSRPEPTVSQVPTTQPEIPDTVPPVLTLAGQNCMVLTAGEAYIEPGFTAFDTADGDLTPAVTVAGMVQYHKAGVYELIYSVRDGSGNEAALTRTVTVLAKEPVRPVLPQDKVIYLTFDDGPGVHTLRLLDILDKYGVKATFFVAGTDYIDLLAQITQRGHAVGVHTVTHRYSQIYTSVDAYFRDLYAMQDLIYEKTGVKTTLMRFPGGSGNLGSKEYCSGIMTELTQAVVDQGFQYFDWNVVAQDAAGATTTQEVYENVIRGIEGKQHALVLQHDVHGFSVDAVEAIIIWGLANGYRFCPLTPDSPGFHQHVSN